MEVLQPIFECPVCLEKLKDPKVLSCFHSLCSLCVQKYAATNAFDCQMPCPTCRQVTPIPAPGGAAGVANLPVNSYLVALMDMAAKVLESTTNEIPSLRQTSAAPGRGDDVGKGDGEVPRCSRHSSEDVQLYCASCSCPICIQCVLTSCKQHEHKSIAGAAGAARNSLTQLASRAGSFMGSAARAGTDTRAYCVDMREQRAACLRALEQRKADVQAVLQSAYDNAVRHVERRTVAWEAKATEFLERVDRSQSECQRQLIEVGELISHRSNITVVANFAAVEKQVADLLESPWLREAALSKEKFLLSSNNEFLAPLKKFFLVSSAEEHGTALKLLRSAEGAAAPADVASTGPIAPVSVGKTQSEMHAATAYSCSSSAHPGVQPPLVYPGSAASSASAPSPALLQPIVYPGMLPPQPATAAGYAASGYKLGSDAAGLPPLLSSPSLLSYPAPALFAYPPPPPMPSASVLAQPLLLGAVGPVTHLPLPASATAAAAPAAATRAAAKTSAAGKVHPSAGTASVRSSGSPAPAASPVQVAQKPSKKVVKKAVKGHFAGLTAAGNTADVVGSAILAYLCEAQCDSKVLAAVVELFFVEASARPEVSRGLARVSGLLDKLPAVANCAQPGKTTTYKKLLQDRIKLELDLKAAAAVPAEAAATAGAAVAERKRLMLKVQFIVYLFEEGVVSEWALHDCIIRCLKEESFDECLEYGCGLLAHYRRRLDTPSGLPRMNQHLNQIKRIIALPNVSPSLVTMFQDILQSRSSAK